MSVIKGDLKVTVDDTLADEIRFYARKFDASVDYIVNSFLLPQLSIDVHKAFTGAVRKRIREGAKP